MRSRSTSAAAPRCCAPRRRRGLRPAALLFLVACGDNGEAPLPEVTSAASWVDPRIGTGGLGFGHGSCFVGPTAPHGLAKPGPDTSGAFGTVSFQHYSGYFAEDDKIRGFSSVHLHGTGATDYGVLSLMPTLAFDPGKMSVVDYETRFAKSDERVEPGYYGVTLANGIDVELTASKHVALHRYTFPAAGSIVIDLARTLDTGDNIDVAITPNAGAHEVTGSFHHMGGMSSGYGGYTLYFVLRVAGGQATGCDLGAGRRRGLPAHEPGVAGLRDDADAGLVGDRQDARNLRRRAGAQHQGRAADIAVAPFAQVGELAVGVANRVLGPDDLGKPLQHGLCLGTVSAPGRPVR